MSVSTVNSEVCIPSPASNMMQLPREAMTMESPANDYIFETRLHQLLQTLQVAEAYNFYPVQPQYVYSPSYTMTQYAEAYPVVPRSKQNSPSMLEMKNETTIETATQGAVVPSEVHVPFEVNS